MRTAQSLAEKFEFDAWPTFENVPVLFGRIKALFDSGRSVTLIEYYVHDDAAEPRLDISAGLRVDPRPGGAGGGVSMAEDLERRVRSISVGLTRLVSLGIRGDDEVEEQVLAQRFRDGERRSTQIEVSGWGTGIDDFIEVRHRNEHGVLLVRRFQFEDRDAIVTDQD